MAAIRSARRTKAAAARAKAGAMLSSAALSFAVVAHPAAAEPAEPAPFSVAAPGEAFPGEWRHQKLPKVERANRFDLVRDGGSTVLRGASPGRVGSPRSRTRSTSIRQGRRSSRGAGKCRIPSPGSDFTRKDGDDYAGRVYVTLFDLPVERLTVTDRLSVYGSRAPRTGPSFRPPRIAYSGAPRSPWA